jgi:EAL and modified HD-GYP domain-containing signal transduction protein
VADLFVARQPIFDRHRTVVAYELLFRSGLENAFGRNDPAKASLQMMNTTLLGFGLDALVGDKGAFFNASRDVLVNEQWAVLPARQSVIEVLETVEPDAQVVGACAALKRAGYRVALDDFVFRPEYEALLPYTDYIKVDFLATREPDRASVARRFAARGIQMLAEKVENYQEFEQGLAAGYQFFQGYFFCRPEMVTGKDIAPIKSNLLRLIQEVNRPEVDFERLETIIKQEVALSVKLLRYLHSAGFGWKHEVATIGQALRVLGERPTRKWASLVALTLIGEDKPAELVTTSLVRAQFCEELGAHVPLPETRADLFLTGLLSTLDALLDRPLELLLDQMSVSDEIRHALLGGDNHLGATLALAVAYDRADWAGVEGLAGRIGFPEIQVPDAYRRAVDWVGRIFRGA